MHLANGKRKPGESKCIILNEDQKQFMSIYHVLIGKKEYQVDISDNQYKIDGETVHVKLSTLKEQGFYLLQCGAWKREFHVQVMGKRQYLLDANGRHALAQVEKSTGHEHQKVRAARPGDLSAPMPGVVVSLHVSEGDSVEFGQLLAVLESMKMQMELHAPCVGVVTKVTTIPGTLMAKGDLLMKIDPV